MATDALVQRGGVESVLAESKVTLGALRGDLSETKQLLVKAQEETKQELKETKEGLMKAQEETKQELTLLTEAQERTHGRIAGLEAKMDALLEALGKGASGEGRGGAAD